MLRRCEADFWDDWVVIKFNESSPLVLNFWESTYELSVLKSELDKYHIPACSRTTGVYKKREVEEVVEVQ